MGDDEDEEYVDCAHCGVYIPESKAIFVNGMPFCENCHGEIDVEFYDDDEDDDEDDDDDWEDDDDDNDGEYEENDWNNKFLFFILKLNKYY